MIPPSSVKVKLYDKLANWPFCTAGLRKSNHLLADRIRRLWNAIIAKGIQHLRDAVMVVQKTPSCSKTNWTWGRMHMQY